MPSEPSREARILLAFWRKAHLSGPFDINLSSYPEALSLRMAMYRAIQPYRNGSTFDPVYSDVAESYIVSVAKNSSIVQIIPRRSLGAAEKAMADLGLSEDDLLTPEELAMRDRMARELEEFSMKAAAPPIVDSAAPLSVPNKFFTR